MATRLIDDAVIHSASAEEYFLRSDRRVMIGLRAVLEMLDLPLPHYAIRRPPGPTPGKSVALAYNADHPQTRTASLSPRRDNASATVVAAARTTRI
jgi:hypothetical protein